MDGPMGVAMTMMRSGVGGMINRSAEVTAPDGSVHRVISIGV